MVKAIYAEVNLNCFFCRACSNQYESVSTWLYFFTSQLCFCLETDRKLTQVAYDNIQQDGKIHIEAPENY